MRPLIDLLDDDSAGPSARFPACSRHVPTYALLEVSLIVTGYTADLVYRIRRKRGTHERIAPHVEWYFDLRMQQEFWRCRRCCVSKIIDVPGRLDQFWLPQADKAGVLAYGELAATFVDAHVSCRRDTAST